ncbi:MAG: hypothetical protein MUD14_08020 [Hydrococcus sp. Prado102]|jgi:hypothetical protein|nr:hypothetical protein [Hydrococcus sp. Prado102]
MSKLVIHDLDFCQTELPNSEQVRGGDDSTRGAWDWDFTFDFDFDDDGISGWSVGNLSAWGLAIGPVIISSPK